MNNASGVTRQREIYSCFAGNDYLGLASHSEVVHAATQALERYGVNFSASRATTGTSEIHLELEKVLSSFKGKEDTIVFSAGYQGNSMILHALKDRFSAVFADAQAHPSIVDGLPDKKSISFYEHCNPGHLETLLKRSINHRPLIITDGIFALTGEIAPLADLYLLADKYNALLVVDDAHATGILGKTGRGTPEFFNLDGAVNLFQTETMSKALGAFGGFIAADKQLTKNIRLNSTFYRASTALPPPLAAAGCATVRLIQQNPVLRETLKKNSGQIRDGIKELGFTTTSKETPIIPIILQSRQVAVRLSAYLKENHILVPAIDYPVKTGTSIVRITASSNHTAEQISYLLFVLKKWMDNENRNLKGH